MFTDLLNDEFYLVADTRERAVICHHEFVGINMVVKQITVGDYVVCRGQKVITVFERKSLEDFAASLKDGRADNKRKLLNLRDETSCNIVYIIEGKAFPGPNDIFGGIPYRYIESSIFHLMARDNITILRTKDTLHTAQTLCRYVMSMRTLHTKPKKDIVTTSPGPLNGADSPAVEGGGPAHLDKPEGPGLVDLIAGKIVKTDHELVRALWSVIPGISVDTADSYISQFTLADIVLGRAFITEETKINGRRVNKRVINVCKDLSAYHGKFLQACPGISKKSAENLVLTDILTADVQTVGNIMCGNRKLGVKGEKILTLFNYKE